MPIAASRAPLWATATLALFATSLAAQEPTLEVYAGGASFRDTPANEAPVVPTTVAIGPDGRVYISDAAKGRLVSFDPVTNTATALPGIEPQPPYYIAPDDFSFSATALAVNPSNELFGADWDSMWRINVQEGTREYFTQMGDWPLGTSFQMTFDANGNLYYIKRDNAIYSATGVYRRNPWGYTERLIQGQGGGGSAGDGGPLSWAQMGHIRGVALDSQGNLYLSDSDNNRVRKVTAIDGEIDRYESIVTTVAGNGEPFSYEEGVPATSTGLANPESLAVDAAGNLYVYERYAQRIRRVSAADGTISTYAGNGNLASSGDGGPATEASIDLINGNIVVDAASNLYLAEMGANRLRRVDAATGIIDTVLGNGTQTFCTEVSARRAACLGGPQGVAVDNAGNVYISDSRNLRIRRIDAATGELRTIAGTGFGYTHSGDGGPALAASFGAEPGGISFDAAGNLLIAGTWANNVRRIDTATGIITTIAGTGVSGFSGDGGLATAARFNGVQDVVTDAAGNVYLSDTNNRRIRKISASGVVTTIAGNGSSGFSGDGGPATAAALEYPTDIGLDSAGNVLFVDATRLRRINASTGIITTIAGNGSNSVSGDGGAATAAGLGWSFTFLLDGAGNIIVSYGSSLRRIDAATGIITSLNPPYGLYTDDGRSIHASSAIAFGPQDALFITDPDNDLVFRVDGISNPDGVPEDITPPVIVPGLVGTLGNNFWFRSNVQLTWSVIDEESAVTTQNGCSSTTVTEDTAGVQFTCTATSSGGTSTQTVTVKKDTNPPFATFGAGSPAPNAAGWNNSNVSFPFTVTDTLSGFSHASAASPITVSTEGMFTTSTFYVTDMAGNSNAVSTPPVHIDRTAPTINIIYPAQGGSYGAFTTLNAQYVCQDNQSTQVTCAGTVPHGTPFSTNPSGSRTFSVTATDAAGNQATANRSYNVTAMVWNGWVTLRRSFVLNRVTAGSLVPIRWRQTDGRGQPVSNLAAFQGMTVSNYNCASSGGSVVTLVDPPTGGPGLTYSASTQAFTYNWQTDPSWTGCQRVLLQFSNNTSQEVLFQF